MTERQARCRADRRVTVLEERVAALQAMLYATRPHLPRHLGHRVDTMLRAGGRKITALGRPRRRPWYKRDISGEPAYIRDALKPGGMIG